MCHAVVLQHQGTYTLQGGMRCNRSFFLLFLYPAVNDALDRVDSMRVVVRELLGLSFVSMNRASSSGILYVVE